jgi:hypothetical protein
MINLNFCLFTAASQFEFANLAFWAAGESYIGYLTCCGSVTGGAIYSELSTDLP